MPHSRIPAISPTTTSAMTRRAVLALGAGTLTVALGGGGRAALAIPALHQEFESIAGQALPIRWAGGRPGDGFLIRHGYATENTWYNPGWWHTGEDWYALDDAETGGAEVVNVAPGVVVFVGSDYPGRVVIVQHLPYLYSMYGHLDDAVSVAETDVVEAGQTLGTVLTRTDGVAPSHLHFEIRSFLFSTEVNGDAPRYDVACGYQCAPGPGYWPQDAPEHPSALGWLNPLEEMASWRVNSEPFTVAVSQSGVGRTAEVFAAPGGEVVNTLVLEAGDTFTVTGIQINDPESIATSAEAYGLWYEVTLGAASGWVSAIAMSSRDTGSDGRPSGIDILLLPTSVEIVPAGES
ncbi:MAG: M23 family metallopeptidase [Thermomicrobiales bacterium]